jgi:hypothetical protein
MDRRTAPRPEARTDGRRPGGPFAPVRPKEAEHHRFHYGAYGPVRSDDMALSTESGDDISTSALAGRIVVDAHYSKVGTVTDILVDDRAARHWAVVKTGALSGEHLMPLDEVCVDTDGRLVVRLNKTAVKHAPRVGAHHALTAEQRRELRAYYGIEA